MDKLDKYKRLINGEQVKCSICNEGYFKPMYNVDVKICTHFKCDKCGGYFIATKKLIL